MTERDVHLSHGRVRVVDAGSGPALVLVHGLGGSWSNWAANIPELSRSHRVVVPDLPGFGRSEAYQGEISMERYVETLFELLDHLGIESATFVGNSMGGLLTIEAAVSRPDRVSAAVLVCSGGIPLTSARHRFIEIPRARAANNLLRRSRSCQAIAASPRLRRMIAGTIVHDPEGIQPGVLEAALMGLRAPGFGPAFDAGLTYDARLRAPLMRCPTLVLWGREDGLLPMAMGEELHRLIPDSSLEIWDATGHCPMIEDPERFNAEVVAFTARVAAENLLGATA